MVPKGRLELPRVAPHAPQACVSTYSTTSANTLYFAPELVPVLTGTAALVFTAFPLTGIEGRAFVACCSTGAGPEFGIMDENDLWPDL